MKYLVIFMLAVGIAGWGQATTYNLNNDTATHGFSLPLPCPSTTGGNCNNLGTQNNQAYVGANSIWAECGFSLTSSFINPECSSGELAASSSSAAAAHSQYVHIVRATDSTTAASGQWQYSATAGGAGDVTWDSTATRFAVFSLEGVAKIFSFDPNPADTSTYMQVTVLYGSSYTVGTSAVAFSKITNHLMYRNVLV